MVIITFLICFIPDEDKPSIVDAISRMNTKQLSPKKFSVKPVEEVKKDISPADFFGLTPVQAGKDIKVTDLLASSLYTRVI